MLALERQATRYPVLIPDGWGPEGGEATRRRRRRYPVLSALTIAAFAVLPLIAYVAAVSNAAHIGYRILQLRTDIAALETDHARLQAIASSLKAPDRLEHLATARLGLQTPAARQIAAIMLSHAARGDDRRGLWERLGAYLHHSEAQAAPLER